MTLFEGTLEDNLKKQLSRNKLNYIVEEMEN